MTELIRVDKKYFIGDGMFAIVVIVFIIKLSNYNKKLYEIQAQYSSTISQAMAIAQEEHYFIYLILGFLFVAGLVSTMILYHKHCHRGSFFVLSLVNLVLLIILLVVFWNPVLATFAFFLLGAGGVVIAKN